MKDAANSNTDALAHGAPPGPGSLLKDARESAGLERREVAAKLHLDLKIIIALEENDFKALPAATFVRGYLRSYTQLLGLPFRPVFEALDSAHLSPPRLIADISDAPHVRANDMPVRLASYGVIATLIIMIVLWWNNQNFDYQDILQSSNELQQDATEQSDYALPEVTGNGAEQIQDPAIVTQQAAPESTLDKTVIAGLTQENPATSTADAGVETPAASVRVPQAPSTQPSVAITHTTAEEKTSLEQQLTQAQESIAVSREVLSQNNSAGEITTPTLTETQTQAQTQAQAKAEVEQAPQSSPAVTTTEDTLSMHFSRESWVTVYDRNENRLFYNLTRPDQTLDLRGPGPLRVVLGRPQGTTVLYNGKPLDLGPYISSTGIARFTGPP